MLDNQVTICYSIYIVNKHMGNIMKQRLVNFSFLVSGHVVQDIVITDPELSGEELVAMFNRGEAFTSVDDDSDVINDNGDVIGTIQWSDRELSYDEFQVENGEYEQEPPTSLQPFNVSRLAHQFAIGEFISDHEDDMSTEEIIHILNLAGDANPLGLSIVDGFSDMTGNQLLREIELAEHGFKNIMTIAHTAGKQGKEII